MPVKRVQMDPYVDDVQYLVRDEAADLTRIYKPQVLTRSRKRSVLEAVEQMTTMQAEMAEREGLPTVAQEKKSIRLACDVINLLLFASDDAPAAGDMLFKAWEDELTPENAISEVLAKALGLAEDPPDPT